MGVYKIFKGSYLEWDSNVRRLNIWGNIGVNLLRIKIFDVDIGDWKEIFLKRK